MHITIVRETQCVIRSVSGMHLKSREVPRVRASVRCDHHRRRRGESGRTVTSTLSPVSLTPPLLSLLIPFSSSSHPSSFPTHVRHRPSLSLHPPSPPSLVGGGYRRWCLRTPASESIRSGGGCGGVSAGPGVTLGTGCHEGRVAVTHLSVTVGGCGGVCREPPVTHDHWCW